MSFHCSIVHSWLVEAWCDNQSNICPSLSHSPGHSDGFSCCWRYHYHIYHTNLDKLFIIFKIWIIHVISIIYYQQWYCEGECGVCHGHQVAPQQARTMAIHLLINIAKHQYVLNVGVCIGLVLMFLITRLLLI